MNILKQGLKEGKLLKGIAYCFLEEEYACCFIYSQEVCWSLLYVAWLKLVKCMLLCGICKKKYNMSEENIYGGGNLGNGANHKHEVANSHGATIE